MHRVYIIKNLRYMIQKDLNSLERVQRKAARFCTNGYHPTASVTDMIRELGWQTLEQRISFFRLTLLYKMSHGLLDIDVDFYLSRHNESRTRGSLNFKYTQYRATTKRVFLFLVSEVHKRVERTPCGDCWGWLSRTFPVQSGLRDYVDSG